MLRVIDTETTSLEGSVLEIASVDIVDGVICNPMSDFVKPTEAISFEAMAIHHITEDMVADAPLIGEVIGRYLARRLMSHTTRSSINLSCRKSTLPGFVPLSWPALFSLIIQATVTSTCVTAWA